MDRLLYATPTGGHPKVQFVMCLRAMDMGIRSFGVRRVEDFVMLASPVQMARTKIVAHMLQGRCFIEHDHREAGGNVCKVEPYDYLLMHDDDLMVEPFAKNLGSPVDAWHKMMQDDPTIGVVGAVYLREAQLTPTVVFKHPAEDERVQAVAGFPAAPFEVGGIGTGFMLISRACLEAMAEQLDREEGGAPMFRFALRTRKDGTVVEDGEDYDFCRRANAAGFKVMADPRFDTVHVKSTGQLLYNRDDWEARWERPEPGTENFDMRMALFEDTVASLRAQTAPKMKLVVQGGFLVLDQTDQIAEDTKDWRNRVAVNKASKAA